MRLAELWSKLRAGAWVVRESSVGPHSLSVVVEETRPRKLSLSGLAITERVLLGTPSKVVACERNIRDATVACSIRDLLKNMGLSCRVRAVPQIVTLALFAHHNCAAISCHARRLDDGAWLISTERPRLPRKNLSPAEYHVLARALEGATHNRIAYERRSSMRTVRNQAQRALLKLSAPTYAAALELTFRTLLDESPQGGEDLT